MKCKEMSYLSNNKEQGFTVLELLVSVAIGALLLGITLSMFNVQRKTLSTQEQRSEMQQTIRSAMDIMVRDIRMAGFDPNAAGFTRISIDPANDGTITVYADISQDSDTNDSGETVTYFYDAPQRQIERNSAGNPIAENIEDLSFDYLDSNGIETTTISNIRQIRITITGRTEKADPGFGYSYGTATSSVTPLNLSF